MRYPIPAFTAYFEGDRKEAIALLKRVTLAEHRFICIDLRQVAFDQRDTRLYETCYHLAEWIEDQLQGSASFEGWLQEKHGIPPEECFPHEYPSNKLPQDLKATKLAWVAQMIAYLEKQG